jgi:hypothetical protein
MAIFAARMPSERGELVDLRLDLVGDKRGLVEQRSALHHAVPHGHDLVVGAEVLEHKLHAGHVVGDVRTGLADAFDEATQHRFFGVAVDQLVLDG